MLNFLKKDYKKYLTYVIVILLVIIILYTFNYYFNKEKVILIIASDVIQDIDQIKPYLLDNVIVVMYRYYRVTRFSDITSEVEKAMKEHKITKVKHVGLMFHTKVPHTLSLFEKDKIRKVHSGDNAYDNIREYSDFLLFIQYLHTITGASNIDLISCKILPDRIKNIFNMFRQKDYNLNLSITNIGGDTGNWYLEQGNVNLIGIYFNKHVLSSNIELIA